MVRARYRGRTSFRMLAATVCLVFLAATSVGYAVPGPLSPPEPVQAAQVSIQEVPPEAADPDAPDKEAAVDAPEPVAEAQATSPFEVVMTEDPLPAPPRTPHGEGEPAAIEAAGDVHRTFRLVYRNAPADAAFFLRYVVEDGGLKKIGLTGQGPWTASMDVPAGCRITTLEWWASCDGRTQLLRSNASFERLVADGVDEMTFTGGLISGTKYEDRDADCVRDQGEPGLEGVRIVLSRILGSGPPLRVDSMVTDANGWYCFDGLLPGDYVVSEEVPAGWQQTEAPIGAITVCDRCRADGMDFGDVSSRGALQVSKTGPAKAHIGDTVEYRIMVRNTGETVLGPVDVRDALTGFCETAEAIPAGGSCEWTVRHTLAPTQASHVDNVVTAVGRDPLGGTVAASATWRIGIVRPSVMVVKTADRSVCWPGTPVTFTYRVVNTGDIALEDLSVDDPDLGHIGGPSYMDPGDECVFTKTAEVWASTAAVATVIGHDLFCHEVRDCSQASVAVRSPSMVLTKTPSASTVLLGEPVRYTFVVTNTGDEPLCDIEITDDVLGDIGAEAGLLQPGASLTFTREATHTAGCLTNTATAKATFGDLTAGWCGTLCATATATVCVVEQPPSVSIVKTVDRSRVLAGATVEYLYTIVNTGVTPLTSVRVTDDRLGAIGELTRLEAGQTATMTRAASIQTDTVNVGTVRAIDVRGNEISASDDASVTVARPSIRLDKTPSPAVVPSGGTVRYTYVVTNIGDETLFDVRVDDDRLGRVGQFALPVPPGGSTTFTRDATIAADVTNIATATASFGDPGSGFSGSVSDTDTASVSVFLPFTAPDLAITKSASMETARPGDEIVYTLRYRNVSGASAVDFTVTDTFDPDLIEVIDAAGGDTRARGRIVWSIAGPLSVQDGERRISYTVRVRSPLPAGTTRIDNVARISVPDDTDASNDVARESVSVEDALPFLPFTGGGAPVPAGSALLMAAAGLWVLGALKRRRGLA